MRKFHTFTNILSQTKKYFITTIILIFLWSCEDIFLRFRYENFKCKKNKFNIEQIKVTKHKIGSKAQILFGEEEFLFEIIKINKEFIILENKQLDILIRIFENGEIKGLFKKNVFTIKCSKEEFRI